jgi:arylsulfatase A-like enzyme
VKDTLYRSWFLSFAFYNVIFLCLQLAFILSKGHSFIQAITLPAIVYLELITTFLIHLSLYCLLAAFQTTLMWGSVQFFSKKETQPTYDRLHIIIWSLTVCALLVSNSYFFPLSAFSRLLLTALPKIILSVLMIVSIMILALLTINTLFFASRKYPIISSCTFIFCLSLFFYVHTQPRISPTLHSNFNIILIGIDSLSPSNINTKNTPSLVRLINKSVLFKETISPLAHTYPAWSSILTGLYPAHHHAEYNLMPPEMVNSSASLAWSLQRLGYQTIFATDDRRFNNLGKEFGFQQIIGPPIGANEILLGTFNDFPLSNLLSHFSITGWLFPYNHMNRASYFTYYPQTFDNALRQALATNKQTSPLFMAVHFTMPHWPYAWAQSSAANVGDEYSIEERGELYFAALRQVDKQVSNLLNVLQRHGYLNNSLVILLSDHGEALYVKGSRQTNLKTYQGIRNQFAGYLKRKTSTELEKSIGHGSDLLSPDQFHSLLAFQIYKHDHVAIPPKIIPTRVALIDIRPTIEDFLGQATTSSEGISLRNTIINSTPLPARMFIMESGMLPNQFVTREKVKLLGQQFFVVKDDARVQLRKQELSALNDLKLYAIIKGPWIMALYPDDAGYIPVILNLKSSQWTDEFDTDFVKKSPAKHMLLYLQQFYHKKWKLVS